MTTSLHSEILLYDSVLGAREVAWMLRAKWDGCNGVTVAKSDLAAIKTAASLLESKFCRAGDYCILQFRSSDQSTLKDLLAPRYSLPDALCNHSEVVETTGTGKPVLLSSILFSALHPGSSLTKITRWLI